MRILHIVRVPRHSGAEILVDALVRMQVLQNEAVGVCALYPAIGDFGFSALDIASQFIPHENLSRLNRLIWVARSIKRFSPDIVFAHSVLPSFYARAVKLWCGKALTVVTVLHDASLDDYAAKPLRYTEHLTGSLISHVVAVHPRAAESYQRRFGYARAISVIPNGIDSEKFSKTGLPAPADIYVQGQKYILQVGRISRVKQQHLTLRAALPILKKNISVHLLFAGVIEDKTYLAELNNEIQAEGMTSNVQILGSRQDINGLLQIASCYVMPSAAEAHSVAMLEALASGVPIVASNIDSFHPYFGAAGAWFVEPTKIDTFTAAILLAIAAPRAARHAMVIDLGETVAAYQKLAASLLDLGSRK